MKHLLITFFSIISLQLFAQEKHHNHKHAFYPDTKIKMPTGEVLTFIKFNNSINLEKDFIIDFDNPKTIPKEYYIAKQATKEEKKKALKQRDIKSDKLDKGSIAKNVDGKVLSWFQFHKLYNSGEWGISISKDKKTGRKIQQLKPITDREREYKKKREIFGKWKDSIIGTPAPKFEIVDMEGNNITSENTKGKPVLLNFWFTTCPPCIKEIPALNRIYKKYKDQVVFASISRDWKEKVLKFEEKHPIDMPVSVVSQNNIDTFNINGFPTNIVIDSKGNYYAYLLGGRQDIEEALETKIKGALNP